MCVTAPKQRRMQSNNGIINSLQMPCSGKKIGHDIASGVFPLDDVVSELQRRKQLNFSFLNCLEIGNSLLSQ